MSPAMLYRLAVETGLRAGELRSLTRASFVFDVDVPTVVIAAAYAKNRRQDTLRCESGRRGYCTVIFDGKMPAALARAAGR